MRWSLLALGLVVGQCDAYASFKSKIPNADKVKGPDGEDWPGVGHTRAGGGGPRNQFGKDFASAEYTWTKELCQKDSDGDGRSNGQELGDPNCVWKEGDQPTFEFGISHPGITDEFQKRINTCESFSTPPGAKTIDITFSNYAVPSTKTNYVKQAFTFPADADYDLVKFEAVVANPAEVHHMILYGCARDVSDQYKTPAPGKMPCTEMVFGWAVGGGDFCMPKGVAMRMLASKPYLALEIHYDNSALKSDIVDSSGFRITYIPKSDQNQVAAYYWMGAKLRQTSVPPGKSAYTLETKHTNRLTEKATIFAHLFHMHKLGRKAWTLWHTNGRESKAALACKDDFSFDLQEVVATDDLVIQPGDNFTNYCVYDSTSKTEITNGGDDSDDEMCISFYLFYPAPNGQVQDLVTPDLTGTNKGDKMCKDVAATQANATAKPEAAPEATTKTNISSGSLPRVQWYVQGVFLSVFVALLSSSGF